MKVKYRFWATDDVDVKEEVVKLNVSKFFNDAAKAAFIKNEWNKWAMMTVFTVVGRRKEGGGSVEGFTRFK